MITWKPFDGFPGVTLGYLPGEKVVHSFLLRELDPGGQVHLADYKASTIIKTYKNIASAKRAARRIYAAAYPKHALQWTASTIFANAYMSYADNGDYFYVAYDKARNGYAALRNNEYITDKRYHTIDKAKAVAESHNRKRK